MTRRDPVIVLLDTNFLMVPIRFGVDLQSEFGRIIESSFKLATTTAVVEELKRLRYQVRLGEEKDICFAISMADKITIINDHLKSEEDVDDQLLRLAKHEGFIVATTDLELRRKLRKRSLPVVFLRQSRHLVIEGFLTN